MLPVTLPPGFATFLRRCLEKDPRQRIRDVGDMRLALEGAFETTRDDAAGPSTNRDLRFWQRPVPAIAVIVAVAVTVGILVWNLRPSDVSRDVVRFAVAVSNANPDVSSTSQDIAISPDGSRVAYVARAPTGGWQLYVRDLDDLEVVAVPGSGGATGPFFPGRASCRGPDTPGRSRRSFARWTMRPATSTSRAHVTQRRIS